MTERELYKLTKEIYRLADFLAEMRDKDLSKKYPLVYENADKLFEAECKRLEEWLEGVKNGSQ